jgi:superfamily II DNA or RNA helicase
MNSQEILQNSRNWESFKSLLSGLSKKQKGDAFELLTKYYLQLYPTYTTLLKNVWLLKEVPSTVRKKINLPSSDEGIDLIAETKYGTYWAVQCKYKEDENDSITRRELSTFTDLSFNICKGIELGLVCTSNNRFSRKLDMHGDKLSYCAGEIWRALDVEFFEGVHAYIRQHAQPLKPSQPRPHQQRAVKNAYRHLIKEGNSRGKLIMPCGTGKSLAGYWISQKLESKKILIAVPSLALIRQTLEVWARESVSNNIDINWIVVCGDESVVVADRDDISVLTKDLGIKIHTDPDEVSKWLKTQQDQIMVVFTTYQSGEATAAASRKAKVSFDLGVMDEAHKTTGKSDSLFSHLLFDENIEIKKRIFMTATERRYKGDSDEIISMDDPEVYGDTFEFLSFKEALEIDPPILCDYKVVTIFVSRSEVASLIDQNIFVKPDKGKWNDVLEAEMLSALVALRKSLKDHPIKKSVSFHSSISRAKAFKTNQDTFTKVFPEFGSLETFHVSGATPTSLRAREINDFTQAESSLITNARCLTEGVDVPNIDCILFADPKNSVIDIVQATGRALRPHKSKVYGYVIVPVLIDDEKADLDGHQQDAFKPLISVLRALAADDERIVEYFHTISEGKRPSKNGIQLDIQIPAGIIIDTDKFIQSIELKVWSRIAHLSSWRPYEEAREFSRALDLISKKEWELYSKGELPVIFNNPRFCEKKIPKPDDIPINPHQIYKNDGWLGYKDWLGLGTKPIYRSFKKAREYIHSLGFKSKDDWTIYKESSERPQDIPGKPSQVYSGKGWKSLSDWLGVENYQLFRSFEEARNFSRSLKFHSQKQWKDFCEAGALWKEVESSRRYEGRRKKTKKYRNWGLKKPKIRPADIPHNPEIVYKDVGWKSYNDWLGTEIHLHLPCRPFEEARMFTRTLNIKSPEKWMSYCQGYSKPEDIPIYPEITYKDKGWKGYQDWLGITNKAERKRLHQLAKQGDTSAQFSLGAMFQEAENFVEAYRWFSYAYDNGNISGHERMDALEKVMTPSQISRARKRIMIWK